MTSLKLSKNDQYFIAIAKHGIHSFLMLGVMQAGTPKLLARVGKTNDIDPHTGNDWALLKKQIGSSALARLQDEGVARDGTHRQDISYQAYDVNFEQVKQYLHLIADIERRQLLNKDITEGIKRRFANNENAKIKCYVPGEVQEDGTVTFDYKKLSECPQLQIPIDTQAAQNIATNAQNIKVGNTCRSTAINIIEAFLGFVTDISRWFFISPKHQTKLVAGQPDKASFYVLPPPPNVHNNLSPKQIEVLNKLYKRMDDVATLSPDKPETRAKFDALKATYKSIAGENKLSATALFAKILKHEQDSGKALYKSRDQGILSKLFGLSTTTEKMFKNLKSDLQKEKIQEAEQVDKPPFKAK